MTRRKKKKLRRRNFCTHYRDFKPLLKKYKEICKGYDKLKLTLDEKQALKDSLWAELFNFTPKQWFTKSHKRYVKRFRKKFYPYSFRVVDPKEIDACDVTPMPEIISTERAVIEYEPVKYNGSDEDFKRKLHALVEKCCDHDRKDFLGYIDCMGISKVYPECRGRFNGILEDGKVVMFNELEKTEALSPDC